MSKKTLILGASLKENRYSNIAIHRLVASNYEVRAFGLKRGEVSGITINTILNDFEMIDTVSLYMNPSRQKEYYQYLIDLNPKRIIFNPGTENPELYELLEKNDIYYEASCTLVLLSTNQY